ncbi:MAG: hypothetical protein AB7O28_13985 [Vicinamibacterales bacterium]
MGAIATPRHATRTLLASLRAISPARLHLDTALGDWYANRVGVDRHPLLLLVSATSPLAIVVPARDLRGPSGRLAVLVEDVPERVGGGTAAENTTATERPSLSAGQWRVVDVSTADQSRCERSYPACSISMYRTGEVTM